MELDTQWIDLFDEEDTLYGDFYKSNVESIEVKYVYINEENEIFYVNKEQLILDKPNVLSKEKLIYTLKHNMYYQDKKYKPIGILQFNYDYDSDVVIDMIKKDSSHTTDLVSHHYIEDIHWKPTISFIQDVNSLYILFYYDPHNNVVTNTTRKVLLRNLNDTKNKTRKRT